MLEIYHPPHVAREEAARKMLWRVLLSFAILAVSMIPFFFQLTKDSEQNRDAVYKTTSTETELCLILVLAVVLAVIFYLSVTGTRLSGKIRAQFKEWAFYRGTLYHISARIPGHRDDAPGGGGDGNGLLGEGQQRGKRPPQRGSQLQEQGQRAVCNAAVPQLIHAPAEADARDRHTQKGQKGGHSDLEAVVGKKRT